MRAPAIASAVAFIVAAHSPSAFAVLAHPRCVSGWTLIRRLNQDTSNAMAIYSHVAGSSEPSSYTWTSSAPVKGIGWISGYIGVDNTSPIEAESGQETSASATQYTTPSITVSVANTMVVSSFAGYQSAGTNTTWTAPSTTAQRANVNMGATRSGTGIDVQQGDCAGDCVDERDGIRGSDVRLHGHPGAQTSELSFPERQRGFGCAAACPRRAGSPMPPPVWRSVRIA
jgi:hypothetical protein